MTDKKNNARILVVDDQAEMAHVIADQLGDVGYEVDTETSGEGALRLAKSKLPDLVVADLRMEGVDGFDVLAGFREIDPQLPVLIMTAFGSIDTAVEAIKRGAYHYLTKPFQLSELLLFVERALDERKLKEENRALRRMVEERAGLNTLVGKSPVMQSLYALIEKVAASDVSVLIRGESGTGKELVAQTIHLLSPRKTGAFVAVNCTALPEQLLESELFGHLKGSFTGATVSRRGLLLEADRGTLFLDEIGDMPMPLQAKLLRVLEDGGIRAVGSDTARQVDVRVVAATHQDLEERIREGRFRADLFYRLNVFPISVPPLRERADDIPLLAQLFLKRVGEAAPRSTVKGFSLGALALLADYHWPGNVRELKNTVQRMMLMCEGETVSAEDLKAYLSTPAPSDFFSQVPFGKLLSLSQLKDTYISHVIRLCKGNKAQAARILDIDVSTIHRRDIKV